MCYSVRLPFATGLLCGFQVELASEHTKRRLSFEAVNACSPSEPLPQQKVAKKKLNTLEATESPKPQNPLTKGLTHPEVRFRV